MLAACLLSGAKRKSHFVRRSAPGEGRMGSKQIVTKAADWAAFLYLGVNYVVGALVSISTSGVGVIAVVTATVPQTCAD